ncbi:Hsp20/alpha crystallin family protein [Candidatus Bathyarchaeota archaeon]|nr:Hsp20/alpha crystallin family protein [Candidatus Bathyarchaeota archaeon]
MPSNYKDFPDWYKRRRYPIFTDPFFGDIDSMFLEIERMMEEELKSFTAKIPKDYVRERKLPDGSTTKEWGPFVYGYSMNIGPDGKPRIREFGNVKKSLRGPQVKEEREPLVDVFETESEVRVVAELPGVEKNDIKLHGTEETLTISVTIPRYKYYKEVNLPSKVKVREAKSFYKNGVLEVIFQKAGAPKEPKGEPIDIG